MAAVWVGLDKFLVAATTIEPRMQASLRAGVFQAALTVTESIRAELPSSGRLRGVGLRGAKIGAGFTMQNGASPSALIASRGPLKLLERDTRPHTIRARRATALTTPFGPRVSVKHPGTRGQHPFQHGVDRAAPVAQAIINKAVFATYVKSFGA